MSASAVGPQTRPPMAAELYAAGRIIGLKCFDENMAYMKCKDSKGEHPTVCTAEGDAVHTCVYGIYKDISAKAPKQFAALAKCLDGADLQVPQCKKLQEAFERAYYSAS